jgi:murein DD-endopeptidase MepM/ murein hydrolase activator NlpD
VPLRIAAPEKNGEPVERDREEGPDRRKAGPETGTATPRLLMKRLRLLTILVLAACEQASQPAGEAVAGAGSSSPSVAVLSSTAQSALNRAATTGAVVTEIPADAVPGAAKDPDLAQLQRELMIPVQGVVAGELRDTFAVARSEGRVHDAIDIPAPRGTPVLSASRGRVLKLFTSKAGGLMVYAADPSERFILLYGHLDGYAPGLADGAPLSRGQTIGFVGTTGNAPPNLPHLHFAVARSQNISDWWKGTAVNPYPLLKTK